MDRLLTWKTARNQEPGISNPLQDRGHDDPHSDVAGEVDGKGAAAIGDAGAASIAEPRAAAQRHCGATWCGRMACPFPHIAAAIPHASMAHSLRIGGHSSSARLTQGLNVTANPLAPLVSLGKFPL